MGKKKKVGRNEAFNELKTLESKWLKDHRLHTLAPIQTKVMAAKVSALLELIEQNELPVNVSLWPLSGAEDLAKMDETQFKQGLSDLQKIGVLNSSLKFRLVAGVQQQQREELDLKSDGGDLTYRCVKPGGINLADRDEYVLEDQEVAYTEEAISESQNLQTAIANEWLLRIEKLSEEPSA